VGLFLELQGKNIVKFQWVYNTKFTFEGIVERHKSRLVANGFSQQEGINYAETFSPVSKMNFVQLIISLTLTLDGKYIIWMSKR
jgi:hypothetical protein